MQCLFSILMLLTITWSSATVASSFVGGGDALVREAVTWVSEQTGYPQNSIQISAPDRTIAVEACDRKLQFRFPFKSNQRTVEVQCETPTWKRFLRVKLNDIKQAIAATRSLAVGHQLTRADLKRIPYSGNTNEVFLDVDDLIGLTLNQAVKANYLIERSMVADPTVVFMTDRSYEAGELIQRSNLTTIKIENAPATALKRWPSGIASALVYLEAGQILLTTHIEPSEYVVVSATNIVRGQVITEEFVERRLQAKREIGAQALKTAEEAIGLEATRTIRAGSVITLSDLTAADLIRKGEKVTLTLVRGALTITVDTIAMANAKMGEQVELTNVESGKVIRGIVTGRYRARGIAP